MQRLGKIKVRTKTGTRKRKTLKNSIEDGSKTICINKECKLRKSGCKGFVGCPGYKTL